MLRRGRYPEYVPGDLPSDLVARADMELCRHALREGNLKLASHFAHNSYFNKDQILVKK